MVSSPATILTIVGAVVAVAGGLMGIFAFPKIIKNQIEEASILMEGSDKFTNWVAPKTPVVFKLYFFNVSNAEDVQNGAKPIVKEIGPYVYNQYKKKINITYADDVMSFHQHQVYEFDEKATAPLRDTDRITIVNLPLMAMIQIAEYRLGGAFNYLLLGSVNSCIPKIFSNPSSIFLNTTPREFLFDGIPLMCNGTRFLSIDRFVCNIIEHYAPPAMPRSKDGIFHFSIYGWKNNTHVDYFSLNTGVVDIYKIGEISAWQNTSTMNLWPEGGKCNEVGGSDGGLFPPFRTSQSVLKIFIPDVCRPVHAHYIGKTKMSGLDTNRYLVDENIFDSPSNNSVNGCFCLKRTKEIAGSDGCLLDGVIDGWDCQGAPVIMSFPHFYRAHEAYQNGVDGLHPNKSLHRMYLDLEPLSGAPLYASKKAQINVLIKPVDYISLTANLPTTLMPVLWIDEIFVMGDDVIDILNTKLFSTLELISYIKWGIILGGIILFVLGLIGIIRSVYGPAGFRKLNVRIIEKS